MPLNAVSELLVGLRLRDGNAAHRAPNHIGSVMRPAAFDEHLQRGRRAAIGPDGLGPRFQLVTVARHYSAGAPNCARSSLMCLSAAFSADMSCEEYPNR